MLQFGCDPNKFYEEHPKLLRKRVGNMHTESKCICGNIATVVGPGGFDICRSCDYKIYKREWDVPTLAIVNNAGYKVFRFHWLNGDEPSDGYGTGVAEAFTNLGYGDTAVRAVDYHEEITEANLNGNKRGSS